MSTKVTPCSNGEIRRKAKEALRPKQKTMTLIALTFFGLVLAMALLSLVGVGQILSIIFNPIFTLGLCICSLLVVRNQELKVVDFFDGYRSFGRAIGLSLINGILIFLWSLLLLVPGIIKSYSYSQCFYLLADHPDMTGAELREESEDLMDGNRMRLFRLQLSFIGWFLLGILTCGILLVIWVLPYWHTTMAQFYEELKKENTPPAFVPLEGGEEPVNTTASL